MQQTWPEGAAVAEAGAAAAAVEEMAVTKESMACASSSLGLHAPGPVPYLNYMLNKEIKYSQVNFGNETLCAS